MASRIAIREQLGALAKQYALPLWMTEVSHGEVDPRSFDDLRGRAIHIHDELRYADASAYYGMNNMWDTLSQQAHFGNRDLYSAEGVPVLIDTDLKQVIITGMGHAIGHYARWIRPGVVRLEATADDARDPDAPSYFRRYRPTTNNAADRSSDGVRRTDAGAPFDVDLTPRVHAHTGSQRHSRRPCASDVHAVRQPDPFADHSGIVTRPGMWPLDRIQGPG